VIGHGMDFWVEFQQALEAVQADVITFGEATDTSDALRRYQGRLNGILDFPLARALRLTFATGDWSVTEFDGFLDLYDEYMADGPLRVSFLDNHDMDRFLHVAGQDRDALLLGLLCLLTLPCVPVIYYGTEIGMTHEIGTSDRKRGGDALARQDMIWDERNWDIDLKHRTSALIRLRHGYGIARSSARRRLHVNSDAGTYAYELSGLADGARLVVVINVGREARTVAIDRGSRILGATKDGVSLDGGEVTLPARAGAIVG
jgi:cyclomaltodextrinase / maltogenic alpha-amylase / neopullulanase